MSYRSEISVAPDGNVIYFAHHRVWANPSAFPLAVVSPGMGANAALTLKASNALGLIKVLHKVSPFFMMAIVDAGGLSTFGNDTAIAAVEDSVNTAQARFGNTDPVLLLATSMGFTDLMAWARAHVSEVRGAIGAIPLPGLEENNAAIDPAYGGNYVEATHGATHNAMTFASQLTFPIRMFYASNDTTVLPQHVLDFEAAAPDAVAYSVGALGHTELAVGAAADHDAFLPFIAEMVTA